MRVWVFFLQKYTVLIVISASIFTLLPKWFDLTFLTAHSIVYICIKFALNCSLCCAQFTYLHNVLSYVSMPRRFDKESLFLEWRCEGAAWNWMPAYVDMTWGWIHGEVLFVRKTFWLCLSDMLWCWSVINFTSMLCVWKSQRCYVFSSYRNQNKNLCLRKRLRKLKKNLKRTKLQDEDG